MRFLFASLPVIGICLLTHNNQTIFSLDNWWFNFTAVGKPPATTVITICNQRPWVRDPPCEHYGNLTVAIIP